MTRAKLLLLLFIFLFLTVVVKLFYLQVVHPSGSTLDNYLRTTAIYPERGNIYDRNHNPLVLNQNSYSLYVEPKKVTDVKDLAGKLASVLHVDEASIEAKIDPTKIWVAIQSGIEEDTKKSINNLNLAGVGFNYNMKRYYPEASLSAHLLGFVGKNSGGEDVGYFGLEGFYDKDLKGIPGLVETERDVMGNPIFIGTQHRLDAENGRDLQLTIDKTVQEIVKNKLKDGMEMYKAKQGCVIVANPVNMQILALACLPDYDNSIYYQYTQSDFENAAISSLYEPGSTFKPFIMAAALEEKAIKPDDFYDETGPVPVGEYKIQTWNNEYEGKISMTRILEKSSNVGMVYIGQRLGNDKLFDYIKKYGFGEMTGIDLQGEASGYLRSKKNWYPIDYATATFGQGLAVTPIQMIRAFSSLINGGKVIKPSTVEKIIASGDENVLQPRVERSVIHNQTTEIIKKMLVSTVENGEVKWAKPKGYTIGGKTGTAQVPIAGHYDPTKTIASFIGFAPVANPKFIALVILHEPKASRWGSETAAPIFFEIAKDLIVYYNITPDQ